MRQNENAKNVGFFKLTNNFTKDQQRQREHIKDCTFTKDDIINPDCPKCQDFWCKFVKEKNLFVIADGYPAERNEFDI